MIRTANICRQLKKNADLTMLAVAKPEYYVPESIDLCQNEFTPFYKVNLKSYSVYPRPWSHCLLKWHMHNPFSCGFKVAPQDQQLFEDLCELHDIVWFHTLGAAHPFRIRYTQKKPMVIDLDDLKDAYYEHYSETAPTIRFKWSAKVQAYKWRKHQQDAIKNFHRIIVCSDDDKTKLDKPEKVRVVPNGYMPPETTPQWTLPDPKRIGFIGLLTYPPNRDGLIWFRDHVWPLIRKKHPAAALRIIGKHPAPENLVDGQGFEYLGFLKETLNEMKSWSCLVVPITFGGGTRIKILDAFSKMVPVVATTIGAHGITGENQKHIIIEDNPAAFAAQCLELLKNPQKGRALAQQGWKLFSETYSWEVIGSSLRQVVDELIM
jgi:glycosyltransferase involved in cell wall biosynthesis